MTPQEKMMLKELYEWMNTWKAAHTITKENDDAIRGRFSDLFGLVQSAKAASSENKSVNEGGVATYSVLNTPDGFMETTINGTTYNLPYYN